MVDPLAGGRRPLLAEFSDTLDRWTTAVAVWATAVFAAIMLSGVFFRYVLNASLSWSDELATIVFGWAVFLFIASAYLHDEHVSLDVLVRRVPPVWQDRLSIAAEGLAGGFLLVLLVSCIQAWGLIGRSHTDALRMPLQIHFAAIPVAMAIMLVHWARRTFSSGSPRSKVGKLLIAIVFLGLVALPVGQYIHVTGWSKAVTLGAALFAPMLIGVPIAISLGLMASVYVAIAGDMSIMTGALQVFNGVNVFVLVAIPLLILSGKLMHGTGIARRLVEFAVALIGRVRGGLGASNVLASFLFGDISGSAVADTAAIGSLMIPEMKRRGYRADFCAALQGAAGTLGMTAPLSITVLLYAAATNTSVSHLAAAMIFPSLVLVASFIAFVVWHAYRNGYPKEVVPLGLILPRALRALPGLLALVLVIGGILGGVFTPAEVGAILLGYIVLLAIFVYRAAKPSMLYRSCVEAGHISGMTLFMVCTSAFVGFVFSRDLVSVHVANAISQVSVNQYYVLFIMSAVFLVLGMFLEPPAMIFGFLPTFLPLLAQAQVDIVHWGVLLAINAGIGCILPPVALNLFVSTKLAGVRYGEAVRAAVPFIVIMMLDLAVVAALPNLSLALPHVLFGYPLK